MNRFYHYDFFKFEILMNKTNSDGLHSEPFFIITIVLFYESTYEQIELIGMD
jgi:hypothetical protein